MAKNLELKARRGSRVSALKVCARLGAIRKGALEQVDTYFNLNEGRLKVREINGRTFELIYYRRPNKQGSRYSDYTIVPLVEPRPMKEILKKLFGVAAVVKKRRLLFLYRNARIHIDSVERLGSFVEFEILVLHGKDQAHRLMSFLAVQFAIAKQDTISQSYVDLMLQHGPRAFRRRTKKALAQRN
jgi:predicted adenylyl cyclase CyaB